jgi:hypothetical protein
MGMHASRRALGTYLLAHSNGNLSFGSAVMRFFECFAKDHFLQEQTDRSSVDALMHTSGVIV